jgi:hypothetical protein
MPVVGSYVVRTSVWIVLERTGLVLYQLLTHEQEPLIFSGISGL